MYIMPFLEALMTQMEFSCFLSGWNAQSVVQLSLN